MLDEMPTNYFRDVSNYSVPNFKFHVKCVKSEKLLAIVIDL
jgi:hypothetical protein